MYSTENELLDDGVWVIGIGSSLLKQAPFCQGIIDNGGGVCGKSLLLPLDFIVNLKFPFASFAPWKKSYDQPRQHIKKQRHYFTDKGLFSQSYGFSSSHIWM